MKNKGSGLQSEINGTKSNNSNGHEEAHKTQENLQQKLYFLNAQLQSMVQSLPVKYQQRFPNELLCALAESLLDSTIFGIINHLMDIQHYTEKQLFNQRISAIKKQLVEVHRLRTSSISQRKKMVVLKKLQRRHMKELIHLDKTIVSTLDEKKRDQQGVLVMAEVPGFEITNDPVKVKVQVRLIDFILRLSQMKMKTIVT